MLPCAVDPGSKFPSEPGGKGVDLDGGKSGASAAAAPAEPVAPCTSAIKSLMALLK